MRSSTAGRSLPDAVTGTRSGQAGWAIGPARRWQDSSWRLRTVELGTLITGHSFAVRFDQPIAPGVRLADPGMSESGAAKRALVAAGLSVGFGDGPLAARGCAALGSRFDWILRWRHDRDKATFAELDRDDFDVFVAALTTGGLPALVDAAARMDAWRAAACAGEMPFPGAAGSPVPTFDGGAVAAHMGVTTSVMASSGRLRSAFLFAAAQSFPDRLDAAATHAAAALAAAESRQPASASMIEGYLGTWRHLSRASQRGLLPDPLAFDPFARSGPRRLAARLGSAGARTPTLDPSSCFVLLRAATCWLVERGPAVVLAVCGTKSGMGGSAAADPGAPAHLPGGGDARFRAGEDLDLAIRHLMAACAILIGFLAARRAGEVCGLRAGRTHEPRPGVFELSMYVEKSIRDVDRVAVPALVIEAVRVLEALSLPTRNATGEEWLFRVLSPTGRIVEYDPSRDMRSFAAACGLDARAGACWQQLASHQLRRGHSIFFVHGYRLGTLEALSRQLRHADLPSTVIYVSEAETGGLTNLRDACEAAQAASLAGITPKHGDWLQGVRDRLAARRAGGLPFDEPACEEAVQRLLHAVPTRPPADAAPRHHEVGGRVTGVRIGSQAGSAEGAHSLLRAAAAHAAALRDRRGSLA